MSRACNLARGIDIRKETVLASMMLSVDVLRCNGMEEQEGLLMAAFFLGDGIATGDAGTYVVYF